MIRPIAFCLVSFVSTLSNAGPLIGGGGTGPMGTFATCKGQLNDGTAIEFQVRATAAPGTIDAILVDTESNSLLDQFLCQPGGDIVPGTSSAGEVVWICKEYKTPRLNLSVQLQRGGFSGLLTGRILEEQMYPLSPKIAGRLVCQ